MKYCFFLISINFFSFKRGSMQKLGEEKEYPSKEEDLKENHKLGEGPDVFYKFFS